MSKAAEESQAAEQPAEVPWKRITWKGLQLNLAIGIFLIMQRRLLGVSEGILPLAEVFGLSLLISWQFVAREAPSRFLWHGITLGVMAIVLRMGVGFLLPGVNFLSLEFILPATQILLGCMAGALVASRR